MEKSIVKKSTIQVSDTVFVTLDGTVYKGKISGKNVVLYKKDANNFTRENAQRVLKNKSIIFVMRKRRIGERLKSVKRYSIVDFIS